MADVFIYDVLRTPRGRGKAGKGGLANHHPQELLAQTLNHMAERKEISKQGVGRNATFALKGKAMPTKLADVANRVADRNQFARQHALNTLAALESAIALSTPDVIVKATFRAHKEALGLLPAA